MSSKPSVSVDYDAINGASALLNNASSAFKSIGQNFDNDGGVLVGTAFVGETGGALQKALAKLTSDAKAIASMAEQMSSALTQSVAGYTEGDTSGASTLSATS